MTTGGFTSAGLGHEEQLLQLNSLGHSDALQIGEIALALAKSEALAISIEVRLIVELAGAEPTMWRVFHYALPGALPDQPSWISRKANVVLATGHSTLFERVLAEENSIDWYEEHGLSEVDHAIHGGGIPLNVVGSGPQGILLISGLPQVEDHLFAVRVLTQFLARQGEML